MSSFKAHRVLLILLLAGLVFSSIIRIRFNVHDGFQFQAFWIRWPLPLFDMSGGSPDLHLTSTSVGYVFLLAFTVLFIIHYKKISGFKIMQPIALALLILVAIGYEMQSLMMDINGKFNGQHLRIGPFMFLLSLLMFLNYRKLTIPKVDPS